jgi:hypothetical protein
MVTKTRNWVNLTHSVKEVYEVVKWDVALFDDAYRFSLKFNKLNVSGCNSELGQSTQEHTEAYELTGVSQVKHPALR